MSAADATHIEVTAGICGGKPRIAGHRIRVQDIAVWHERHGLSPDEIIATHYPQLSLAQVHSALAYYYDHRDEIRADLETEHRLVSELRSRTPSKLVQKLTRRVDATSAHVS